MPNPRCPFLAPWTAMLLAVTWLGMANASEPAVEAQSLFDEGTRLLAAGCLAIQASESLDPGSVELGYLTVCPGTPTLDGAESDPLAAQAKAEQGRTQLETACRRFEASYSLAPAPHTLLRIASCDISQGKLGSAWQKCQRAEQIAVSQGHDDSAQEAKGCMSWLKAKVSYLTVKVAEPVSGMKIRQDGETIAPNMLGQPAPIDPGKHEISATAIGYQTFKRRIEIGAEPDSMVIAIPRLIRADSQHEGALPPPQSIVRVQALSVQVSQPTAFPWPWVIGGTGAAVLLTGGVFGILALTSNDHLATNCPNQACEREFLKYQDRRDREATIANVGVGLGLAALGSAGVLVLLDRDEKKPETEKKGLGIRTSAVPRGAAVWMEGEF